MQSRGPHGRRPDSASLDGKPFVLAPQTSEGTRNLRSTYLRTITYDGFSASWPLPSSLLSFRLESTITNRPDRRFSPRTRNLSWVPKYERFRLEFPHRRQG